MFSGPFAGKGKRGQGLEERKGSSAGNACPSIIPSRIHRGRKEGGDTYQRNRDTRTDSQGEKQEREGKVGKEEVPKSFVLTVKRKKGEEKDRNGKGGNGSKTVLRYYPP